MKRVQDRPILASANETISKHAVVPPPPALPMVQQAACSGATTISWGFPVSVWVAASPRSAFLRALCPCSHPFGRKTGHFLVVLSPVGKPGGKLKPRAQGDGALGKMGPGNTPGGRAVLLHPPVPFLFLRDAPDCFVFKTGPSDIVSGASQQCLDLVLKVKEGFSLTKPGLAVVISFPYASSAVYSPAGRIPSLEYAFLSPQMLWDAFAQNFMQLWQDPACHTGHLYCRDFFRSKVTVLAYMLFWRGHRWEIFVLERLCPWICQALVPFGPLSLVPHGFCIMAYKRKGRLLLA